MTLEQLPCENAFRTHVDVPLGRWLGAPVPVVRVKIKRLYVTVTPPAHTLAHVRRSRHSSHHWKVRLASMHAHATPRNSKVSAYPTGSDAAKCSRALSRSAP